MSIQLQLSSDAGGAPVTNPATGDRFTTRLSQPIIIDEPGTYAVQVVSATAWFTSPNVSAFLGNNEFSYTSAVTAPLGVFAFTIPDGLYSTEDLTATIASTTTANGHGSLTEPLFTFVPLVATQKVDIVIDAIGTIGPGFSVDNSIVDAMPVSLLGFAAAVLGPTIASPETFVAPGLANMAQGKEAYQINTTLQRGSVGSDGGSSQAIVTLPLNVTPNSQVTYQSTLSTLGLPLALGRTDSIDAWVSNQNGVPLTLNSNPFTIVLAIVKMPTDQTVAAARQF